MENELSKEETLSLANRQMLREKGYSVLYAVAFSMNVAVLAFMPFTWWSLVNFVCVIWMLGCFKQTTKKQIMIDNYIKNLNSPKKEEARG